MNSAASSHCRMLRGELLTGHDRDEQGGFQVHQPLETDQLLDRQLREAGALKDLVDVIGCEGSAH